MNKYTIYCTEEQTKKAFELGAPIEYIDESRITAKQKTNTVYEFCKWGYLMWPTAEQMIGWLNIEMKIFVMVRPYVSIHHEDKYDAILINLCNGHMLNVKQGCDNNKEAVLAAIDAALDYLVKVK